MMNNNDNENEYDEYDDDNDDVDDDVVVPYRNRRREGKGERRGKKCPKPRQKPGNVIPVLCSSNPDIPA